MQRYRIYRDIRKGAVIWGLPISLFALVAASTVASLIIAIFAFGPIMVLGLALWNAGLYTGLVRWQRRKLPLWSAGTFPKLIRNTTQKILDHVKY